VQATKCDKRIYFGASERYAPIGITGFPLQNNRTPHQVNPPPVAKRDVGGHARGDQQSKVSDQGLASGFEGYVADSADQVVSGGFAVFHGEDFDGGRLVVRAQNNMISGNFHELDGTRIVFQNSVHIELTFAIRRK